MYKVDLRSKAVQEAKRYAEPYHNFEYFGSYSIMRNNIPMERGIKELVWLSDSRDAECSYVIRLYPDIYHMIDLNMRNFFYNTIISVIKYTAKFNMYGIKDQIINEGLVS